MTVAQGLLAEFEQEQATTRKFLERVPADKFAWRPHEKSMTAGQLALHIAESPRGVLQLAMQDVAQPPNLSERPSPTDAAELLAAFDESIAFVRQTLPTLDDARMAALVRFEAGGRVLMELPRAVFLRMVLMNHIYHHRGQLGVYLRLLGAKVPVAYGPSGDESPFDM